MPNSAASFTTLPPAWYELWWDVTVVDDDPARRVLDEFYRLPDSLDEGAGTLLERFTGQGLQVMINDDGELRPATTAELGFPDTRGFVQLIAREL
jgi:hypothetical protein